MLRQRLRVGSSPVALLSRIVLVLFALALVWYGAMLILLAFKVSSHTVNDLSGYRSIYNYLAGLQPADISGDTRLIAGLAGLAGFLIFGYLAFKELPRPYLARSELRLVEGEQGNVDVAPRAIERAIEGAALERHDVEDAAARYAGDEISLHLTVTRARELPEILHAVHNRAREQLVAHGLPELPVNVTLTGYQRTRKRELQ